MEQNKILSSWYRMKTDTLEIIMELNYVRSSFCSKVNIVHIMYTFYGI